MIYLLSFLGSRSVKSYLQIFQAFGFSKKDPNKNIAFGTMGLPHVLSIVTVIVFSVINISSYVIRFTELMGFAQGIVSMVRPTFDQITT